MWKPTVIRLTIIALLAGCPFLAPNGGACPEQNVPAGTITDVHGNILFVSENAFDRGEALQDAVRAGVKLSHVSLKGAILRDIHLNGADLSDADFRGAVLQDCDFSGANLAGANFDGARFTHLSIQKANLTGARIYL
jgi:uncharacterized protein YjbI with pentapeptide repeats